MANYLLWFAHCSGFLREYFSSHKTGVMGVRLCTLGNLKQDFIATDEQFQLFVNWLNACMPDAPQSGYSICVWTYHNGKIYPHVSMSDVSLIPIPVGSKQERPTIHQDIANHVKTMADGNPITAFEVSFHDLAPANKWLFLAE